MNAAKNLDIKLWKKKEHTKQSNGYWKTILKRMSSLYGLGKMITLQWYMKTMMEMIGFLRVRNY